MEHILNFVHNLKQAPNKTAVKKSKTDLEIKTDASPDIPSVRAPNNPIPDIENIKTTINKDAYILLDYLLYER